MTALNPSELHQRRGVDIAPLAELKVFDGGDADTTSEVEDECAEFHVPPRWTILEDHETAFVGVRGMFGGRGGSGVGIGRIVGSLGCFPSRLNGLESMKHIPPVRVIATTVACRDGTTLSTAPPLGTGPPILPHDGNAHVHDPGTVPQQIRRVSNGPALFVDDPPRIRRTSALFPGGIGNGTTIARRLLDSGGEGGSPGHAPDGPTGARFFRGRGVSDVDGGIVVVVVVAVSVAVFVRLRTLVVVGHAAATGHGERGAAGEAHESAAATAGFGVHGRGDDGVHAGATEGCGSISVGAMGTMDGVAFSASSFRFFVGRRGTTARRSDGGARCRLWRGGLRRRRRKDLKLRPDEIALQSTHFHGSLRRLRQRRDGQTRLFPGREIVNGTGVAASIMDVDVALLGEAQIIIGDSPLVSGTRTGGVVRRSFLSLSSDRCRRRRRPGHGKMRTPSFPAVPPPAAFGRGHQQDGIPPGHRRRIAVSVAVADGIPDEQAILVRGKEPSLDVDPLFRLGRLDPDDLALHGPQGLGTGPRHEFSKGGSARYGSLSVMVMNPGRGGEHVVPQVEEAFSQGREVVVGEVGFREALAVGASDAGAEDGAGGGGRGGGVGGGGGVGQAVDFEADVRGGGGVPGGGGTGGGVGISEGVGGGGFDGGGHLDGVPASRGASAGAGSAGGDIDAFGGFGFGCVSGSNRHGVVENSPNVRVEMAAVPFLRLLVVASSFELVFPF
mmetsp:Transcript_27530/g.57643  ORF Transcript_27530/g.57643 Transcript_27530/m.57643 type:complete len:726 (-) Transcript_27530:2702-4879(-)